MPLPVTLPNPPVNLQTDFQAQMEPLGLREAISLFISRETALAGQATQPFYDYGETQTGPAACKPFAEPQPGDFGQCLSAFGRQLAGVGAGPPGIRAAGHRGKPGEGVSSPTLTWANLRL